MKVDFRLSPYRLNEDKRYDEIIRCATEEFFLNGYAGTSIELIADKAGVSKPTIYKIVGDKYELANVVLHNLADSLETDCRAAIDLEDDPEECLVNFATSYINWMCRQRGKTNNYGLLRLLIEMANPHPEYSRKWNGIMRASVIRPLSEYIHRLMSVGYMSVEDPAFISSQFLRSIYQTAESILAENMNDVHIDQTRRRVRTFLRGTTSEAHRTPQTRGAMTSGSPV